MEHNKFFVEVKNKLMNNNKKDILAALFILLLAIFFFHNFLGTSTLMNNGHHLHEQTFFAYNYKDAFEKGTLPFWTSYWYSGQPLFGDSQVFFLNLTHLLTLLFGSTIIAINLSILIYFFIAGLGMYILVKHLVESRAAALISAIVYMFNGLIYGFIVAGNPSILEPYSLIPFIFLFILKAKKAKNPLNYSVLAGILLAFQIFSGGSLMLVYTAILIGSYLAFDLIRSNIKPNFAKTLIVGLVLTAVLFGLSAVKLLPNFEFIKSTNRAEGLSYQEYIGSDKFIFNDFLKVFVFDMPTQSIKAQLGIAGFLLVILSLAFWRKRMVLFFFLLSAFMLLLATGGFLAEFFYNYMPTFSKTRHIGRVLFVFVFAASVLAGYGFVYLSKLVAKAKISKIAIRIVPIIIIAIILTELVFLKGLPKGVDVKEQLEQNELAKALQQENGLFRITTFDVDDIIAFYGSSYYAQYGLETLSGGGGLWINDFIKYLAIAKSQESSKMLGILNLKYATSTKEINVSGFKLDKKFNECVSCKQNDWTYWIDGPYLYENQNFMPRYYFVDNAVLVIGEDEDIQNMVYAILANENFDPKKAVLVNGKHDNVKDYSPGFLEKFRAIIILSGSIDQESLNMLDSYKKSGGMLFPDILDNKNSIEASEIEEFFASLKGTIKEVPHNIISGNELQLSAESKGFIVMSEKFSLFDGWTAKKGSEKIEILRADNVISAVYPDSPGAINFKFEPKSFKAGLIISVISSIIIVGYFIFYLRKKAD